jgi:hypothetical protein
MTTANTDEVECEDGETRPRSLCIETHDGRWVEAGQSVILADGTVCGSDDDGICYVSSRNAWHWQDNCCIVNEEWEREVDCSNCHVCRDTILTDDTYDGPGGSLLCESCYENEVARCPNCGDMQWNDDCDFNEDGHCTDCQESDGLIANYSDKSANHLRPEGRKEIGIELEVEGCESAEQAAEYIRQFLPATYCTLKRDGSLGAGGVEIVTRPDSFGVHKNLWAPFFANSPGRALSSWNTGRCGMHVHVNRNMLSDLQIGKMLCFMNEPAAVNFISKIAGRAPGHWCKVHKKKISDLHHEHDRYTALNVTGPRTVEFRVFKGTLNADGFMKNLEFVQALVAFTAPASRSIADATSYRAFCNWLPRKDYPMLHAFLKRKGFLRSQAA